MKDLAIVLKQKDDYSLLAKIEQGTNSVYEYVICLYYHNGVWFGGTYTNDLEQAIKIFNDKVNSKG